MPLISIESNATPEHAAEKLCARFSSAVSTMLGKPESYVLVSYRHNPHMMFAGNNEPLAYLELKSLGLPEDDCALFAEKLCALCDEQLGVAAQRVYIEFKNGERHLWGWNNGTFA